MGIFKPSMYKKNIFDINYNKLKEQGITCLVFDLDNTLGLISNKKCPRKTKRLLRSLQDDFLILISSNNTRTRIKSYLQSSPIGTLTLYPREVRYASHNNSVVMPFALPLNNYSFTY